MSLRIYSGGCSKVRNRRRNGRGAEKGVEFEEVGIVFGSGRGWSLYQPLAGEEEEKAQDRNCISRGNRGGRYRCCICTRYYAARCHAEGALGWSPHLEVCGPRRMRPEAATSGSSA